MLQKSLRNLTMSMLLFLSRFWHFVNVVLHNDVDHDSLDDDVDIVFFCDQLIEVVRVFPW